MSSQVRGIAAPATDPSLHRCLEQIMPTTGLAAQGTVDHLPIAPWTVLSVPGAAAMTAGGLLLLGLCDL